MRLTSSIFVSALVRQDFAAGGSAAILRKGAAEAGAIFIVHRKRQGSIDFYGPLPQFAVPQGMEAERCFERLAADIGEDALAGSIERQIRFDSDCWIVEIESDAVVAGLNVVEL